MRNIYARLVALEQQQRNNRPPEPAPPGYRMIGQGLLVREPMTPEQ